MNIKPDDKLAYIKSASVNVGPILRKNIGRMVEIVEFYAGQQVPEASVPYESADEVPCWIVKAIGTPLAGCAVRRGVEIEIEARYHVVADHRLEPIRDQPGNEHWVTESRKTLPRPTPVPGPVTINARGEVEQ